MRILLDSIFGGMVPAKLIGIQGDSATIKITARISTIYDCGSIHDVALSQVLPRQYWRIRNHGHKLSAICIESHNRAELFAPYRKES